MGLRSRQKECDRCTGLHSILYRVKQDSSGGWSFVCRDCWAIVQRNNPHYVYGGTWKARKSKH